MTTATSHFCQSCSMPMASEDIYGTEHDGLKTSKYCTYCYQGGTFVQPDLTLEGMIEVCVPFMVEEGMEENHARSLLLQQLPGLERWRASGAAPFAYGEPVIEQREPFTLAGITAVTTNEAEMGPAGLIGGLWEQFWQHQGLQALYQSGDEPYSIYGCYSNYANGTDGSYQILVGCRIGSGSDCELPAGLVQAIIPASRYAVFTSRRGPVTEVVIELWQHIWAWSPTAPYTRTFTGDFEHYGASAADPANAVVRIYIAISA